jgi:hypothetical protein
MAASFGPRCQTQALKLHAEDVAAEQQHRAERLLLRARGDALVHGQVRCVVPRLIGARWRIRLLSAPQCGGLSSPQAEVSTVDVVDNQQLALSRYPSPGVLGPPEPIHGI